SFISVDEGRVCAGPAGAIASGTATGSVNSFWHGICSITQWDHIANNFGTYAANNFILLADMNHFAGFDPASGTEPPTIPFTPFGIAFPTPAIGTPYTGIFEGNNKKIIGPEYEESSGTVNDLGVI